MKKNNRAGFETCDVIVLSQPPGATCQVYGIFTIDRKALRSARPGAAVIKQDFLVNDRSVTPPEITYYTGFRALGPHRPIEEFCRRLGAPHYGCELIAGNWRCRDHHYRLDEWHRLPKEPEIRAAIERAIERARSLA